MMNTSRLFFYLCFSIAALSACTVNRDAHSAHIKALQKGKIKEDSSFIYHLPYDTGTSHLLVQGYYSSYSHKNRAALDFKMKKGTRVLAARGGKVIRVKQDGNRGGLNKKYRADGNVVVIEHADGSRAGYWHLQFHSVWVKEGDTVQQGQPIGLSGKTGYTLFPHLHFIVWRFDPNRKWQAVGTRFLTSKGVRYLRPMRRYM